MSPIQRQDAKTQSEDINKKGKSIFGFCRSWRLCVFALRIGFSMGFLFVLVLGFAGTVWGYEIKNDREVSSRKPVNISADQLTFDRAQGLTLFTGKVKAVHDQITLIADESRALEDNREATAQGRVKVVDASQGITLTCGNLEYQDRMNSMTAHDHPLLTTVDEEGHPITVLGRQMELDSAKKTVVINQNVQIIHREGRAEAQKATFLSQQDKFILEEDPKVYTDNGLLSGRRIISNLSGDRSVFVEGMADAVFNPNGKPVTASTPPKIGPGANGGAPGAGGPSNSPNGASSSTGPAGATNPTQPVTNGNGLGNNATVPLPVYPGAPR